MKSIRTVDSIGNHDDYEVDDIPRIGELVMLAYGHGGNAIQQHYFRVKDVLYNLQGAPGRQACILLNEETEMDWPD
jgi:hypothetical protein